MDLFAPKPAGCFWPSLRQEAEQGKRLIHVCAGSDDFSLTVRGTEFCNYSRGATWAGGFRGNDRRLAVLVLGDSDGSKLMADFLTRQQIKDKLTSLDRLTVKLFEEYGENSEFFSKFAGLSNDIAENVGPDQLDWTHEQIDAILARHDIDPNHESTPR